MFNGFNVRDEKFAIFKGLNENKGFLIVFGIILVVQLTLVNIGALGGFFAEIGKVFSCVPFALKAYPVVFLLAFTMIPVDMMRKLMHWTIKVINEKQD